MTFDFSKIPTDEFPEVSDSKSVKKASPRESSPANRKGLAPSPVEPGENDIKLAKKKQNERIAHKSELARQKRQENLDDATEKNIIDDIMRVTEDEDNRYPGTCSRDRYKKFGHYSQEQVYDIFGNHSQLQRSAGLRDARATTKWRNKRAVIKSEEHILEYFHREITPFTGKFQKDWGGNGAKRIVVGSDFHSEDCDIFALEVFLDVIKRTQPEYVVLNGDVLDFQSVGKWSKPPNKLLNLQDEIDWVKKHILRPVRSAAPNADISFVIGNHEFRLIRFLADCAPSLASLRSLSFNELLGLDELEIGLIHNHSMLATNEKQKKASYIQNWRVFEDNYVVTHGTACGQTAAFKELAKWQMSGCSGHVHRPQFISAPTLKNPDASWLITGMMAKVGEHGTDFVQGCNTWTTGFGFVTLDSGIALQQNVLIKNGVCHFAGDIYREKKSN
jgi:predicted phosphodiesterase